jgi:hypothetical protein
MLRLDLDQLAVVVDCVIILPFSFMIPPILLPSVVVVPLIA